MKYLILFFILCSSANALDFDMSIGKTESTHDLSASIGVVTEAFGNKIRFGINSLGTPSVTRLADPADWDDDIAECTAAGRTGCGGPYYHLQPGRLNELYISVVHDLGPVGIEIGAGFYKPFYHQDVNAASVIGPHNDEMNIAPIVGIVFDNGIVVSIQKVSTMYGDCDGHSYRSWLSNISIRF